MRPVLRESEIRSFEASWMERGVSAALLMENAGRGAAHLIGLHLKPRAHRPAATSPVRGSCVRCADEGNLAGTAVILVAGPGNNGGDAFVVARHLAMRGSETIVFEIAPRKARSAEAESARRAYEALGNGVKPFSREEFAFATSKAALVVDGFLGIGLTGDLGPDAALVIEAMNASGLEIYALDVPSGLDADTGESRGAVVKATHTITFGHLKRGLLTSKGHAASGRITLSHIGVPSQLGFSPGAFLVEESDVKPLLVPRDPSGHKSSSGRVAVIGGSRGLEGAARLAGLAALRAGAGVVSLVVEESAAVLARSLALDLMTLSYRDLPSFLALGLAEKFDAFVLGPGLGLGELSEEIVRATLRSGVPTVVDADALRILGALGERDLGRCILTPHPGEAGALLGISTAEVEEDRFSTVERLSEYCGATVVLKGSRPLMRSKGSETRVSALGSPSLSVAGSGDVLAGILGAELARGAGRSELDVLTLGVALHALAGAEFESENGDAGLLASELAERIPRVKRSLLA